MPRSVRLVTPNDWPEAEARAAVLAGELVPVGDCWASPAEPQDPELRALAVRWRLDDDRLIACGRTAAWIWGACSRPSVPFDVCVGREDRVKNRGDRPVREIAIGREEVTVVAGLRVTDPVRTALDLLRTPGPFPEHLADAVVGLLAVTDVDPDVLRSRLRALGRAPMSRQGERRLTEVGSRRLPEGLSPRLPEGLSRR